MVEITQAPIFNIFGRAKAYIDWANVYGWFDDLGWEVDPKRLYDYLRSYPQLSSLEDIKFYFGEEIHNQKSVNFQSEIKEIGYKLRTKKVKFAPVFLDKSHFRLLVRRLFDALDGVKKTNSEISNKLYNLSQKVNHLPKFSIGTEKQSLGLTNETQVQEIYELIADLDNILKNLNINIGDLQQEMLKPVKKRKCDFDVEITMDILHDLDSTDTIILFSGDGDYAPLMKEVLSKGRRARVVFAFGHKGQEYEDCFKEARGIYFCVVNKLKEQICLVKTAIQEEDINEKSQ